MHETLNNTIKGYIDSFQIIENEIQASGWAFSTEMKNLNFRVSDGINFQEIVLTERPDVLDFYKNFLDHAKHGWSFTWEIKEESEELFLEAEIDGNWEKVFRFNSKKLNTNISNLEKSYVVVDNFYQDPDSVREFALTLDFQFHPGYHKGKRTEKTYLFPGLKESFEKILGKKIADFSRYGTNGCFQYCIGGDQLVYHYDTQTYAGLIYLTPNAPPQTGTSFFRSRHTSLRKIDFGKEKEEETSLTFKNGFLDPTEFDLVDKVGNVYNRLVLFDARLIHAASEYFGSNLQNGRLFQLFFFDFEEE